MGTFFGLIAGIIRRTSNHSILQNLGNDERH